MDVKFEIISDISFKGNAELYSTLLLEVHQAVNNIDFSEIQKNTMNISIVINPDLTNKYKDAQRIKDKCYFLCISLDNSEITQTKIRTFILKLSKLEIPKSSLIENILVHIDFVNQSVFQSNDDSVKEDSDLANFVATTPKYQLQDVVLSDAVRVQISRALALIQNRDKIYNEWGFSKIDPNTKTIICFYGAAGTGKTMCAQGIASYLGKKIMVASYASIESKWVGEGAKNLHKIFAEAEQQDAVLFFDEADSFLSNRISNTETGSDKHYNRMSNDMFQLLEDYNGIVIFATNLVTDFDKAFKSRILAFVEFVMPDEEARMKLISFMIPDSLPLEKKLSDDDYRKLSQLIDGFSGREIRKAVLTTLSDGALNSINHFSLSNFEKGFTAIKEENEALEKQISGTKTNNDLIQDFLKQEDENHAILGICLLAAWLGDAMEKNVRKRLISISKSLDLEIPDMNNSAYLPSQEVLVEKLKSSERKNEALLLCADILIEVNIDNEKKIEFLHSLAKDLDISTEKTNQCKEYLNKRSLFVNF